LKTKEISVGFTFTKNLGNYESLKVDASVTITVEPGDDQDAIYAKAWANTKQQIKKGLETAKGGF
jgi:hypothetical protein